MIKTERIYNAPTGDDFRILVDRLWPRGLRKDELKVDLWLKEIAPSADLRKWFSHDPEKWSVFKKKYKSELSRKEDIFNRIWEIEREKGTVTLVFGAKDEKMNDAVVLLSALMNA